MCYIYTYTNIHFNVNPILVKPLWGIITCITSTFIVCPIWFAFNAKEYSERQAGTKGKGQCWASGRGCIVDGSINQIFVVGRKRSGYTNCA